MTKTIVSCGVICNKNKLLICNKGDEKKLGHWEFPGGKLKQYENIFKCVSREIEEELSIKVQPVKEIYRYEFLNYILVFIECILTNPEQQIILNEHVEYKWIQIQEINKYNFVPGDLKFVEYLIENENNLHLFVY